MAISIELCGKYFEDYAATKAPIVGRRLANELQNKYVNFCGKVYSYAEVINKFVLNGVDTSTRKYSARKIELEYKLLKNPVTEYLILGDKELKYDCLIPKIVYEFCLYILENESKKSTKFETFVSLQTVIIFIRTAAKTQGLIGRLLGRLDDRSLMTPAQCLKYLSFVKDNCENDDDIFQVIAKTKLYNCHSDLVIDDCIVGFKVEQ